MERADLERFGKVVSLEDSVALLEVPRSSVASITGAVLGAFPVSDVGIEEVEIDDVVRALFTETSVPRGTSVAEVPSA